MTLPDIGLRVGHGVADITPRQDVRLAGFLAREPAVPPLRVLDPLQAHALAWSAQGRTLVLLVLDLVGLAPDLAAALRLSVADALNVPVTDVLTSCTHTHSGPDTLLGLDCYPAYAGELAAACVASAAAAVAALAPVTVGHARVDVPLDLAVNRRDRAHAPVLDLVTCEGAGGPAVCVVGVGIHPVTHGPDVHGVTADWVGHARAALAEQLGAPVVVVPGDLGDVNPPGGHGPGGYDRTGGGAALARDVGTRVADLARHATRRTAGVAGPALAAVHRTVELPVAEHELARVVSRGAETVVAELHDWTLGGVRWRSLPGEPLSHLGAAVRAHGVGPVVPVGLAPSWLGYLPHPDTFEDGYEEQLGLGRPAMRALLAALTG